MTLTSLAKDAIINNKKSFYGIEYEAWMERASFYDEIFGSVTSQAIDHILDRFNHLEGSTLLDIACGTGHLVASARAKGAVSEGIDFAPKMVAAASANYPSCLFQTGDATQLPYEDETFEFVTCSFGLSHIEHPQVAVDEAYRVTKEGGFLAFTLWHAADNGAELLAICRNSFARYATPEIGPGMWTPLRYADRPLCKSIVTQAGFRPTSFHTVPIVVQSAVSQSIMDILFKLSVRMQVKLKGQSLEIQHQICRYILDELESRREDGLITLEWPALLVIAQKPTRK